MGNRGSSCGKETQQKGMSNDPPKNEKGTSTGLIVVDVFTNKGGGKQLVEGRIRGRPKGRGKPVVTGGGGAGKRHVVSIGGGGKNQSVRFHARRLVAMRGKKLSEANNPERGGFEKLGVRVSP